MTALQLVGTPRTVIANHEYQTDLLFLRHPSPGFELGAARSKWF